MVSVIDRLADWIQAERDARETKRFERDMLDLAENLVQENRRRDSNSSSKYGTLTTHIDTGLIALPLPWPMKTFEVVAWFLTLLALFLSPTVFFGEYLNIWGLVLGLVLFGGAYFSCKYFLRPRDYAARRGQVMWQLQERDRVLTANG